MLTLPITSKNPALLPSEDLYNLLLDFIPFDDPTATDDAEEYADADWEVRFQTFRNLSKITFHLVGYTRKEEYFVLADKESREFIEKWSGPNYIPVKDAFCHFDDMYPCFSRNAERTLRLNALLTGYWKRQNQKAA